MTLNQLRVFRAVALTRNIAAAAKSLFMTQPSVSMQLRALEKDLKVPLYERRQGQVILTEAGETLLVYAEAILRAEDEALKDLAALRGALRGRLRIGTNITGGMYVTPAMIREYKRIHPEVEVALAIDTSARIMDSILQGVIDIGVIGGPVDPARFDVEAVGQDELILIAVPDHRLAGQGAIPLDAIGTEALILPGIGSRSRWILESMLRDRGLPIRAALTMSGTEEVKKAVEAGLGVGFVSRYAILRELAEGALAHIPVSGFRVKRNVEIFWKRGQQTPQLAAPLIEIARHKLVEMDERFRALTKSAGLGTREGTTRT